jgi:MYXO-CTERM domain-containing protein
LPAQDDLSKLPISAILCENLGDRFLDTTGGAAGTGGAVGSGGTQGSGGAQGSGGTTNGTTDAGTGVGQKGCSCSLGASHGASPTFAAALLLGMLTFVTRRRRRSG